MKKTLITIKEHHYNKEILSQLRDMKIGVLVARTVNNWEDDVYELVCVNEEGKKIDNDKMKEIATKLPKINYIEYTGKRLIACSSWRLGIDSEYEDENGKMRPYWYILDKRSQTAHYESYMSNRGSIQKDIKRMEDKGIFA